MVRTQVYLEEREVEGISALARVSGKKQSQIIREAIDVYLESQRSAARKIAVERCAGIWQDRDDLPDFSRLRESFDRGHMNA